MATLNFDLPYGPFAAAIKSLGRAFVVAAALTTAIVVVYLFANRSGPFGRSVTVAVEQGPHVVGAVGGGISLSFSGLQVTLPPEEGIFFEAISSKPEGGKATISVTRWEVSEQSGRVFRGVTTYTGGEAD